MYMPLTTRVATLEKGDGRNGLRVTVEQDTPLVINDKLYLFQLMGSLYA